jgi:SanA protein
MGGGKKLGLLLAAAGMMVAAPLLLRGWTDWRYGRLIYRDAKEIPARPVAVVFGALVWSDGRPSHVLADRVQAAAALYQAGKVRKLLLSGDNRFVDYNEPQAMKELALALGVPEEDLVLDYAGRRTYDTCYRARHIFGLEQAVLVTQAFHLDRALFTCRNLGLDAVGFSADLRTYRTARYSWLREIPATALAWWDVKVRKPLPVLGDPIEIGLENPSASGG